ncbi:sensor domain-containing diguanylate cyclase [Geodermatophilus sp. FMUSA9-8]|uniref:sensor domain-containing diguanylate cyclase n=1 Tax=Geodermatophilus sp. FMUSA9-8 TaxID=3120155 RepID=UPI00300B98A2
MAPDGLAAAYETAFRHAPLGIALATSTGVLLHVNDTLCELLGLPETALLGRPLLDFTHPEDLAGAIAACKAVQETRSRGWRHECRLLDANGAPRPVQVLTSWIDDATTDGQLVMVIEDISDRKRIEDRLRHRVGHDALTGLPNRHLFNDRLEHALRRAERDGTSLCLLLIDLDGFKEINDRLGHAAGDAALTTFAARLTHALRASDTAARLGGDEFVLLCEDTHPADAHALIARIRLALEVPIELSDGDVLLGFSVGLAHVPGRIRTSPAAVLAEADQRMYANKRR